MKRTILFAPNSHAKRCCAGLYQRQMERMWAEIEAHRDNPHRESADVTVTSNVVRGTLGVRLDDDQYIGCMRLRTLRSLLQIIDEETAFERYVLSQSLFCPARRPSLSNPSSTVLWRDIMPTSTNPITTIFCADIGYTPTLKLIIAYIFDSCSSTHQQKFHEAFIRAAARIIYREEWPLKKDTIMRHNGWESARSEVLISTPR